MADSPSLCSQFLAIPDQEGLSPWAASVFVFLSLSKPLIHSSLTCHRWSVTRPARSCVSATLPFLFLHTPTHRHTHLQASKHQPWAPPHKHIIEWADQSSSHTALPRPYSPNAESLSASARHQQPSGPWPLPSIQPDLRCSLPQAPSLPTATTW